MCDCYNRNFRKITDFSPFLCNFDEKYTLNTVKMKKQTQAIHTGYMRRDAYDSLSMPV